ncbi:hypothetical protein UK82_07395 [Frankia sp. ACN1ag]|nr:hypothetical protein UK82_07395 [Frankia sp. ACN1ag]
MTTAQFVAWLKIPEGTARQWRHRRYGPPSFRVGGRVRYRRSEVTRWLAEQERAERERAPYCAGRASA